MAMTVIACTGGIGSGKSCIAAAFSALGCPCYNCDFRAKSLYDEDRILLAEVASVAGNDVISQGKLDRRCLAEKIFKDPSLLRRIENIVHPAVVKDFWKWVDTQDAKIIIFESAIYLEKEILKGLADFVIEVTADEQTRISRVMARDGLSEYEVKRRIANQWPEEKRVEKADCVIYTDDRIPVLPQILKIIEKFTDNGKNRS